MNTDIRRSIFCIIMSAEDYLDASERILRLNLTHVQQRELCYVLLLCAGNEKCFNPYYAHLALFFCNKNKKVSAIIPMMLMLDEEMLVKAEKKETLQNTLSQLSSKNQRWRGRFFLFFFKSLDDYLIFCSSYSSSSSHSTRCFSSARRYSPWLFSAQFGTRSKRSQRTRSGKFRTWQSSRRCSSVEADYRWRCWKMSNLSTCPTTKLSCSFGERLQIG